MNKSFISQIAVNPTPPSPSGQISISVGQIVLTCGVFAITATIGFVKWFVSRSIAEYESTIKSLKQQVIELEGAQHNQQRTAEIRSSEVDRKFIELNNKFVPKDDYVNNQVTSDLKLDSIHRRVDEMMAVILKNLTS